MTPSVKSARAAGKIFDFRSFLLVALQTNADIGVLEPMPDAPAVGPRDRELAAANRVDDLQWIAWPDAATESAWATAELALDWATAAQRLGWRA